MTDEQSTQIQITCQSCGSMFDTVTGDYDDENTLYTCPCCDRLIYHDGSAYEIEDVKP